MSLKFTQNKVLAWLGISLIILGFCYAIYRHFLLYPSTEDAYVQANIINVAAQITGPVISISVADHQTVSKGELLFTIDPAPFQITVNQAKAQVAAEEANLVFAQNNAKRILRLVALGQENKNSGDQAMANWLNAKAQLTEDQANLAKAELNLLYTHIYAPFAGIITQFVVRPGNNVIANNTLFQIIEENSFWVDANFKETQLERIQPGQKVKIILDMYPHHLFHGRVNAVSRASGSVFSLLPPENASGNWVKVTQRFPVKIWLDDATKEFPFRMGATASITIDTTRYK